jgi:hypothetical protein
LIKKRKGKTFSNEGLLKIDETVVQPVAYKTSPAL